MSNPERRTKVLAVLKGSDGNLYYGENQDQCLNIKPPKYMQWLENNGYKVQPLNIKAFVIHAEMVALMKMPPDVTVIECCTTFDPCLECLKHLVHRGCQKFYTLKRASKDWNSLEREFFIKEYIPGGLH